MDWINEARARWPGVPVHSNGRYALLWREAGRIKSVYLFADKSQADACTSFYDSKVHDLQPCPLPKVAFEIGYE